MQLRAAAFSVSVVIAETIGGEIYLLTLSYVIAKYNNTTTISLPPCGSHLLSWSSCHVLLCATIFRPLYSSSTTTLEWYDQRPTIESHSILHLRSSCFGLLWWSSLYYTSLTPDDDDEEWSVIARDGFAHQTNQRSPLRRLCVSSVHKSLTYVRRSIGELFIFILNWDCGFLGIKKFFMVWRTRSDKIGNGIREGDRGTGLDRGRTRQERWV